MHDHGVLPMFLFEEILLLVTLFIVTQRVSNDSVFFLKSKTKDKLGLPLAGTSIC